MPHFFDRKETRRKADCCQSAKCFAAAKHADTFYGNNQAKPLEPELHSLNNYIARTQAGKLAYAQTVLASVVLSQILLSHSVKALNI